MKRLLIIHGWMNHRDVDHWHRRLVAERRRRGDVVAYPQLPEADLPNLSDWLAIVQSELDLLHEVNDRELIVIGHSLGCLTWLHAVQRLNFPEKISRVALVAPADPELCGDVSTFQLDVTNPAIKSALGETADSTIIIGSDNDEWTPRGIPATFSEPLDIPFKLIPSAGHISLHDGWGPWQGIIDWIDDPSADLTNR